MIRDEEESNYLERLKKPLSRDQPKCHPPADPPLCSDCQALDLSFFDPTCPGCQDILNNPRTSISEIFAIIRQWVPQIQQHIDIFVSEIFRRGSHIDDTDGLTDMNLLHYVAKSGALGVGDVEVSNNVAKLLLSKGINIYAKCKWTDMAALHYAVFFDIPSIVEILLEVSNAQDIDRSCKEFDSGTALHIACSNMAFNSVKILLKYGANPHYTNRYGKLPIQCIPEHLLDSSMEHDLVEEIQQMLISAMNDMESNRKHNLSLSTLQALGLELHDQVVVSGLIGILRFCGSTDFASGQWAGIELNDPIGKNDGTVAGIRYFKCKSKYGIFAPLTKVKKYDRNQSFVSPDSASTSPDISRSPSRLSSPAKLSVGDRVCVDGRKIGYVRFLGSTKFASGSWVGIELENMSGKNDGSIAGVKYFQCPPKYGVFAPLNKVKKVPKEDSRTKSPILNGEASDVTNKDEVFKSKIPTNINRTSSSSIALSQPKKSPKLDKTLGAQLNFTLKNGMTVYVNNEVGIVRYIGRVEFADDVWLGIELRKPNGKNDGSVEGKKYFACKPKHGLMVRPSRATCRGINCAQLVDLKFR